MCSKAEKAQIHKQVWSTNGPVNGLRSLKPNFSPLPPPFQMPVEAYFSQQYSHCFLTQKHRTLLYYTIVSCQDRQNHFNFISYKSHFGFKYS